MKKRRRLEYRLLRRPAKVADYLRAIQVEYYIMIVLLECIASQYEVSLDFLRKHRMKVLIVILFNYFELIALFVIYKVQ